MAYSFYELVWLFFVYSFVGWCVEVCAAVIKRKRFVNRGFVNSPFCLIYGTGAVAFSIVLPELKDNIFFLFMGGAIIASVIEFITGALLEKIFGKKWWDYSKQRLNLDGYICLRYSLVWGLFAVLTLHITNPIILKIAHFIPEVIGVITGWVLVGLIIADIIGTSLALLGLHKKLEALSQITEEMHHVSAILENAITLRIRKRMERAFPSLKEEELDALKKEKPKVFAQGIGFYKLVSLFFIGAFLGDIVETIFCFITTGIVMSRSSVVYGPFSVVWGIGCVLLTAILYRIKDKKDTYIFLVGTVLGGAYEYVCSVFTELVFGTVFWDYSGFSFNLGGRINLLYCFFWGIASVIWMKAVYPYLSNLIEKIPIKGGKICTNILVVFMIFNCLISSVALARYTERNTQTNPAPKSEIVTQFNAFLDERFTDERMERIYPNAKIVK